MTELIVFIGALGIVLFATGLPPLRALTLKDRIDPYVGLSPALPVTRRADRPLMAWQRALLRFARPWLPRGQDLEERLQAADGSTSVDRFRLEQLTAGLGSAIAAAVVYLLAAASGSDTDPRALPALLIISYVSGFLGRDWWLSRAIRRRREAIRNDLPGAIDLITLSIMAGESIPAACARVADSLHSGIGSEFSQVAGDIRAGSGVVEALEALARRVPEVGVGRLVDALIVALETGTPLAETLRAQSDDGRQARLRYLLETGGRREVLMLVPVCFLILPTVVVFALFPGLVTLELLVP